MQGGTGTQESELKVRLSPCVYPLGACGITVWTDLKESLISTVDTEEVCSVPRPC